MNNQLEETLRDNFYIFRRNEKRNILQIEVPVFSRSVDMVEYDSLNNTLTAIEFKISDWKRAISQLKNVEICFDYLVLCIPKPKTQKCIDVIIDACSQDGIGLFMWEISKNTFSHDCIEIQRHDIWNIQKNRIIDYLSMMEGTNV